MTATASAGGPRTATGTGTGTGKPTGPITRIADFYGAYIDARNTEGGGQLAEELRKFYLPPAVRWELKVWEKKNNADGVLRAQNTPARWKVTDNGTANHTETGITFTWGNGRTTKLVVGMTRDLRILHIGTKGATGS
ncbi:D-lyxose/D-mannose family sugar isomerase [Streptomyces sp. 11x1]|uniref:D-lyxose/D-mannose family sugar isomerase n=1 Tax=Streptomyces sp. 11x1 TaxID=3038642 RepID=UPI00292EC9AB|nr:D-lyxose/D-mannose family sugar isomerase [Streptomyces sp. 11x1]